MIVLCGLEFMQAMMLISDGFEEIEAFTIVDVLRRVRVNITIVGLISTVVESERGVKVITDKRFSDIDPNSYDILLLPGGSSYKSLMNSQAVLNIIRDFNRKGKLIGAICAAPCVLAKAGVLNDRLATVYPGLEKEVPKPRDAKIVVDKNIVTSRSPGTAMDFALKIAEILAGKREVKRLKESFSIE